MSDETTTAPEGTEAEKTEELPQAVRDIQGALFNAYLKGAGRDVEGDERAKVLEELVPTAKDLEQQLRASFQG